MKIMIVDDEQDIQFLFRQQFRREIKSNKIQLNFAFSAEEALQYLQWNSANYITLILVDVNMSGMNGLEMLKTIKTTFPNLKVFVVTAYADEQTYLTAIEHGADAYITKPIEFNELKQKILKL